MRKLIIICSIIALLAISFGLMWLFASMKELPEQKKDVKKIIYVKAEEVIYTTLNSEVNATGRISSKEFVDLITEVSGKLLIADIPLKKGQSFRKGDNLINVFNEEAKLTLKARKSRFLNLLAVLLPDYKTDFPNSFDVWNDFFNSINLDSTLSELPEANSSKEKTYLAGRNILSEYYSIKSDEIRLDKYSLSAPFDGSYSDVLLEVGAVANPGSRIAKIIRTDELELEAPVEWHEAKLIGIGDKVKAVSDNERDIWYGRVIRKSNFVDPETQSINIYVSLKSTLKQPLYKGQYLTAIFTGLVFKDVIEIPRNAVFNNNEVFVVNNGKLEKKEIRIVKTNSKTFLVRGLIEGSMIVIEPLLNVHENMKVSVLEEVASSK